MESKIDNELKGLNLITKTAIISNKQLTTKENNATSKPKTSKEPKEPKTPKEKIINRGSGAGGVNTNNNGKIPIIHLTFNISPSNPLVNLFFPIFNNNLFVN